MDKIDLILFLNKLHGEVLEIADTNWMEDSEIQFSSFDTILDSLENKIEEVEEWK